MEMCIKKLLKVAAILIAIFIVLITSVWIWIATLDLNTQTLRIEKLTSNALGRDVKIDGQLHFSLSLFPRIVIENTRIANPQWATSPHFLTVEKLEIEISLLALLQNQLVFEDIKLTNAIVNLQQDPEKGASWDFRSASNQKSPSTLVTNFVELNAHQLTIVYYPTDRPPLSIFIDDFNAELSRNLPVEIHLISKIRELPLNIDIQGGTLEQLLNPAIRWPFKGIVDTDTRQIDFDGHITNLITFNDIELKISSDKQMPRDSILFGRQFEPLIERYNAKLKINAIDDTYTIKLSADAKNFDLSRLYEAEQRTHKPSLTFQNFTINAEGSGDSMTEVLQAAVVNVTGSNIDYHHPLNQPDKKRFQASINSLQLTSTKNADFDLLLNGAANNIHFKVQASSKDILSTLWQKKSTPIKVNIDANKATAQILGQINHEMNLPQFNGEVSMQVGSLSILGNLFGQTWLETQRLKGQSHLVINNQSIDFNNIEAQMGSQKATGKVNIGFNSMFTLFIKAHANNIDAHNLFPNDNVPPQLVFNLEQINLNIQGKNKSLLDSLFTGNWNLSAKQAKGGWCNNTTSKDCIIALNNLHLSTQGSEPLKIKAQGILNQVSLELDAEMGRLKVLPNSTQASPSSYASVKSTYHPLNLKVNTVNLATSFQGALHKPFQNLSLRGELQVKGELSTITQLINKPLNLKQKVNISAQLATQRDALTLKDIKANTDGIILTGELSYQPTQSPKLTASTSGSINLAHYIEKVNNAEQSTDEKAETDTAETRIIPEISIDYSHYRWLDAFVKINDFNINYNDTAVLSIDSQFTASNGFFKLSPIKTFSTSNGKTSLSSIELDSSQPISSIKYSIQANKIDYGNILKQLEVTNEIRGEMDINIHLAGQGSTLREALATSNGELKIIADKGKIPKWLLELWGSGLLRTLFPTTWLEGSSTDLNCAVGHFKLEDGTMRSQLLLTDTKRVTVAGEVVIDWKTEQIAGILKPQPKDATLMHIGTPLRLTGRMANYKIASAESSVITLGKWAIGLSNPATIILLFGNSGAKDKNPCKTLMKEHLTQ